MAKKSKRIDVSRDQGELTDNPFAALGGIVSKDDLPDAKPKAKAPKAEILYQKSQPYSVVKTKKGGWPVQKEKRSAGKIVTILSKVSGDRKLLLKALQKSLGVGGKVDGDTVQLQGEHVEAVQAFLDEAFRN